MLLFQVCGDDSAFSYVAIVLVTLVCVLGGVTVKHARGLASMDSNGFSDPYAILFLGGKKHKTKTIMKTLDPTWDEVFS